MDVDILEVAAQIERGLREPVTLESLASAIGVPARELQRRFIEATGEGLMEYVRGRRLTVAMEELVRGARRPLDIALELHFASLENLTHAFQARFAFPPRQFHGKRKLTPHPAGKAPLTREYVAMITSGALTLRPGIIDGTARRLVGLARTIPIGALSTAEGIATVGDVIQRFQAAVARLPNASALRAAPLVLASQRVPENKRAQGDGILIQPSMDAAMFGSIPPGFTELHVPACRFAAFAYAGPAEGLQHVDAYIMGTWFPGSPWWFGTAPALSELTRLPDGSVRARLLMPLRRRSPRLRDEPLHPG